MDFLTEYRLAFLLRNAFSGKGQGLRELHGFITEFRMCSIAKDRARGFST
ncbi:hypothetical protein SRRS_08490 [Sporomusa rhizae]